MKKPLFILAVLIGAGICYWGYLYTFLKGPYDPNRSTPEVQNFPVNTDEPIDCQSIVSVSAPLTSIICNGSITTFVLSDGTTIITTVHGPQSYAVNGNCTSPELGKYICTSMNGQTFGLVFNENPEMEIYDIPGLLPDNTLSPTPTETPDQNDDTTLTVGKDRKDYTFPIVVIVIATILAVVIRTRMGIRFEIVIPLFALIVSIILGAFPFFLAGAIAVGIGLTISLFTGVSKVLTLFITLGGSFIVLGKDNIVSVIDDPIKGIVWIVGLICGWLVTELF